jgi:hypothetical protein
MNEFPDWLASALASDASEGKEHIEALLGKADVKRQQDNARLARLQQETRQKRQI